MNNLNLEIPINSKLGIIGSTGCGKTTLVDLFLGLLETSEGLIKIDDLNIDNQNISAWQKYLGYVPQQIFLVDDTIEANIAFGHKKENVNQKRLEMVCKIAEINDYIMNGLPNKYESKIGEQGIRISGGQRQRIGIARALYNNPKVLILDEATSALDSITEQLVIKKLEKMEEKVTMIIIAHRIKTIEKCDNIILLENGKIKTQGKFQDLLKSEDYLIKVNKLNN